MLNYYFSFFVICLSANCYSQTSALQNEQQTKYQFSDLTLSRIQKHYSAEEINVLLTSPKKCAFLQYYYSESFTVISVQAPSMAALKKVDVTKFQTLRKANERVTIIDEVSNLTIELNSLNEIDQKREELTGVSMQVAPSKI